MGSVRRWLLGVVVAGAMVAGLATAQEPGREPWPGPGGGPRVEVRPETQPEAVEMERRAEELRGEAERLMQEAERLMREADRLQEENRPGESREVRQHAEELRRQAEGVQRGVEEALHAAERARQEMEHRVRAPGGLPVLPSPARTLDVAVVPSGKMEDARASKATEDLQIMARVLDKALRRELGDAYSTTPEDALFVPILADGRRQALYLEGYGAVFVVSVRFPLAGGAQLEEPREPVAPVSPWDEAKREVQERHLGPEHGGGPGWVPMPPEPPAMGHPGRPPYDPGLVARLKTTLLETLKQAANMTTLQKDEAVAVVVLGATRAPAGPQVPHGRPISEGREAPGPHPVGVLAVGGEPTLMTIHVKKSDLDAFAGGKLDLEEMAGRAVITVR